MITQEQIRRFHALYRQDRNAQALTAAMAGTDINDLAFVPVNAAKLNGAFEGSQPSKRAAAAGSLPR